MDWLLGRKPSSHNQPSSPPPAPATQQPSSFSQVPPQQEMFEAPDIDSLLKPHDPAALHPLANLDRQTLDYIILEDEQIKSAGALPSRGWTDDLCYGTGTTYLTALGVGGMWGVVEALRRPVVAARQHATLNPSEPLVQTLNTSARVTASAATAGATGPATTTYATRQSGKLLLNNILNHVTRRGPFLGNSAGVLAMTYNILNASLEAWTPIQQPVTPLLSGFLAGAIFRSTKGPKAMAIAGSLVMGVAAAWQGIKRSL